MDSMISTREATPAQTPRDFLRITADRIAVVTLNNPPVNALGAQSRRHLEEAIGRIERTGRIRGVLLVGSGRGFAGGADIKEFGAPRPGPQTRDLFDRLERLAMPVVACMHGFALGGGLELALAAHYRLATKDVRLGFPETRLGLIPGGGGTQRLPRLLGVKRALDLLLGGREIDASSGLALGLIDEIAGTADPEAAGLEYTRRLLERGAGPRRTRDARGLGEPAIDAATAGAALSRFAADAAPTPEARSVLEAVLATTRGDFDAGIQKERTLFEDCLASDRTAGLVHATLAEHSVRAAGAHSGARARPIKHVGVVGGGTMGVGIAASMLEAGLAVTLVERNDDASAAARVRLEELFQRAAAHGRMTAVQAGAALSRYVGTIDFPTLGACDLVIEAVFEDMRVKRQVFEQLDRVCKTGAILATNTSFLDVGQLAAHTARAADVIGLHFFSPAHVMKLLEIVVPPGVASDVVDSCFALARLIGKIAVPAGVCDGFIGNRILYAYREATSFLVEDGASPYTVDRAMRAFGYAMGPFETVDLTGGDISWAARQRKALTRDPRRRYVEFADRLCERGWFGRKSGRGYYRYAEGRRKGEEDPEVLDILSRERTRKGLRPRDFTDDDIVRRYMAAMINAASEVLREGIARRPYDIDVVFLHGYGFPRWRGGPMKYADSRGLSRILEDIRTFGREDSEFWRPSPLLVDLVRHNSTFGDLNRTVAAGAQAAGS